LAATQALRNAVLFHAAQAFHRGAAASIRGRGGLEQQAGLEDVGDVLGRELRQYKAAGGALKLSLILQLQERLAHWHARHIQFRGEFVVDDSIAKRELAVVDALADQRINLLADADAGSMGLRARTGEAAGMK
jgi:hypothetical protein